MGTGKTYSTKYLLDSNNSSGVAGQVLSTTSTGIDWVDANTVPGTGLWLANGNDIYNSNSGNVAIARTNPGARLDIKGVGGMNGLTFRTTDASDNETFYIKDGGTVGVRYAPFKIGVPSGTANVANTRFQIATTAGDFVVLDDGKTGIGTTPTKKIDVYQSTVGTGVADFRHVNGNRILVNPSYNYYDAYNHIFRGLSGTNTHMTIDLNGNVGIGVTNPSTDLHVNSENAEGSLTLSRGGSNMVSGQGVGSIVFPADYNGTPTNYGKIVTYANALSSLRGSIDFKVKSTSGNLLTGLTVYGTSSGVNIGIGTTSPGSKLSIRKNGAQLSIKREDALGTEWKFYSWADGLNIFPAAAKDIFIGRDGASTNLQLHNGILRVLGTGDSYFTGNVGIGTTSPGEKLSVNGNIESLDTFVLNYANNGIKWQQLFDGANSWNLRYYNGSAWSSSAITVKANGNVGIGDTSPSSISVNTFSLSVNSSRNDLSGALLTKANGTIKHQQYWDSSGYSFNLTANSGNFKFNGGNVGIGTTSPASKLTIGGNASGFSTTMQVWQDGETASSGDIGGKAATFFGESGVSNSSIVNIYSTNGYTGQMGGEIGFGGKYASNASVAQFAKIRSFKTNASNGGVNYGGGLEFWTRPNGSAAVPRMTILGDGNVGIGTTSPAYDLDVNGDIRARENIRVFGNSLSSIPYNAPSETSVNIGTYLNDFGWIDISSSNSGGGWLDFSKADGGDYAGRIRYVNSTDQFQISTNNSQKMVIESGGNVGIGTTDAIYKLDVVSTGDGLLSLKGATKPVMRFMVGTSTVGTIQAQENTSLNVSAYGTSSLNLQTAGTAPRLTILTGGNVGIGTTSPGAPLHVNQTSATGHAVLFTRNLSAASTDNALFKIDNINTGDDQPAAQIGQRGTGDILQLIDGHLDKVLVVRDGGNVGIGTASPGSLLEIEGATNSSTSNLLRLSRASQGSTPEKVAGFYSGTSGEKGYITVNNFGTAYNTSSDYRLKENIKPIGNSVERLMSLKPCNFNFISEDENKVVMDGFIAHEAKEVVPEAVTGIKDAVDEKGNPAYQGIDQSKLVPLLTAALQEALQRIEILEQKINN